jgi:hypothetical protein
MKTILARLSAACLCAVASAADLTKITDPTVWRVYNREAKLIDEAGRKFVRLDARSDHGMAWLLGSDFKEGTIEVELRGKNAPNRSFVGIAFRGADDMTYDAVYFRAFNFKNADPVRRQRAVQYLSRPKHNWDKLRAEHAGKYEQPVLPVPDPDDWFRVRIVIENGQVSVFVNDGAAPSLVVNELSERRGGMVGLWVDNGSSGDFANLKITPKNKRGL